MARSAYNWNATRRSLLERLKNSADQESWKVFFDTYYHLIYSVAIKAGLADAEAQDAVQETFIAVAKKMEEFNYDPAKGSFRSWLLHTAQWRICDQLRKRKFQAKPRDSTHGERRTATIERIPDPASLELDKIFDQELQTSLFATAVEKVKHQISAGQYQIFDLYVLKKWPIGKVATTLGISNGRIYLAKHRVSRLVRKELKALESQTFF